jgi:hypothetical protein
MSGKTRVSRNLFVEAVERTLESCRPPRQGYNQLRLLRRGEPAAGAPLSLTECADANMRDG